MIVRDLISDVIPPLKTSDTGLKALSWMEEFKVTHLPIVKGVDFLGLISEEDILNLNDPEQSIGNHKLSLMRPYVIDVQHFYDAVKLADRIQTSLVPVLDEQEHYLGIITLYDLLHTLASTGAIQDPGGIIVLEMNHNDMHMSEIVHIIESNDGLVLSSYITSAPQSSKLELTLKINKSDISRILSAFYRYNYVVKASYNQTEFPDQMKNRFDSFMNYLNI